MEDIRILCFWNYKCLDYWFKYIAKYLKDNNIECKVYKCDREIIINNIKLFFITSYRLDKVSIGRHTSKILVGLEDELEKDFIVTLKEILDEKTERK